VISGIGGLGHLAVQYAKQMGFHVAAIDVDDEKLELASRLGASLTINARKSIREHSSRKRLEARTACW